MALFGLIIINKNYFDKNYFIIFTFLAIYDNLEAVLKPKIEERWYSEWSNFENFETHV